MPRKLRAAPAVQTVGELDERLRREFCMDLPNRVLDPAVVKVLRFISVYSNRLTVLMENGHKVCTQFCLGPSGEQKCLEQYVQTRFDVVTHRPFDELTKQGFDWCWHGHVPGTGTRMLFLFPKL